MSVIDDLVALQTQDALIRELEQHVRDIPIRKAQELERLKSEADALESARTAVRSVKTDIQQAELDLQSRQETILKLKQQQMTLKTNKEFAAMNLEIRQAELALQNSVRHRRAAEPPGTGRAGRAGVPGQVRRRESRRRCLCRRTQCQAGGGYKPPRGGPGSARNAARTAGCGRRPPFSYVLRASVDEPLARAREAQRQHLLRVPDDPSPGQATVRPAC